MADLVVLCARSSLSFSVYSFLQSRANEFLLCDLCTKFSKWVSLCSSILCTKSSKWVSLCSGILCTKSSKWNYFCTSIFQYSLYKVKQMNFLCTKSSKWVSFCTGILCTKSSRCVSLCTNILCKWSKWVSFCITIILSQASFFVYSLDKVKPMGHVYSRAHPCTALHIVSLIHARRRFPHSRLTREM
jgi:hypothetical protein